MAYEGGVGLGQERRRLRDQLAGGIELAALNGPDRRRASTYRAP